MKNLVLRSIFCSCLVLSQNSLAKTQGKIDVQLASSDLTIQWWQWAKSFTTENNPLTDQTGKWCHLSQTGKVWFLAGGYGSSKIKRTCEIPQGAAIFFPIINTATWKTDDTVEALTCEQARDSSRLNNEYAIALHAKINGQEIQNLKKYRIETKQCFDVYAKNKLEESAYPSASDGYWLLIPPLKKGEYVLKFGGKYNNRPNSYGRMIQDIEYNLIIK